MVIGLTGGIGAGKSAVSDMLRDLGAGIVCADEVVRNIYKKGEIGYNAVVWEFGEGILTENGEIDRKKLGELVFSNENELKRLNACLNQPITVAVLAELDNAAKETDMVILDAPLLIEYGLEDYVDEVWLVTCPADTRIERIIERDGLTKKQAQERINSQISEEDKKIHADHIIDNSGSIIKLRETVIRLYKAITA